MARAWGDPSMSSRPETASACDGQHQRVTHEDEYRFGLRQLGTWKRLLRPGRLSEKRGIWRTLRPISICGPTARTERSRPLAGVSRRSNAPPDIDPRAGDRGQTTQRRPAEPKMNHRVAWISAVQRSASMSDCSSPGSYITLTTRYCDPSLRRRR